MSGTSTTVRDPIGLRIGRSVGSAGVFLAVVSLVAIAYSSTGGNARTLLVDEMLINLVLVLGLQIFVGSTGVLSFGHMAFAQIGAYAMALFAIPAAQKASSLPDVPFGLGGVELAPLPATLFAVAVTTVIGAVIGIAVARAKGLSATMITLAVLFVVDQVVKNWIALTRGAGGLTGVPRITSGLWLWLAAGVALVVALTFQETRIGRFAVATREDELAAGALGIRATVVRYWAWVLSIAIVALGGAMRAQSLGSVNPKQYTLDTGIVILAMLVVGGMRTISGAVLGTVVVTAGTELFRQLGDPARLNIQRFPDLFLGGVLLATMLLRPGGLLGDRDLAGLVRRRTRRRTPVPAVSAEATERNTGHAAARALSAHEIGVRFGGFTALDGASVEVPGGAVVGLIGPNGAGKTTLFNVITGIVTADSGRVTIGDTDLSGTPPHTRARGGLARTFQNLRLFSDLTVRDNVEIAALVAERHRPGRPTRSAEELLALVGLADEVDRRARELDYGNQRRLELARAAALAPEVLLLDEPTSGMDDAESLEMVDRVRDVAGAIGASVLVIDHDLGFISRICDHVIVLNEGAVLATGTPAEVRADPRVAVAYLGSQG
jgi:branched-chain amino acid transport system permease protein